MNEPKPSADTAGQRSSPPLGSAFDRLEDLLLEDKVRRQCLSLDKAQELLLKIAKQQQEIQRLNSLLAAERQRSNELTDRWAQIRVAMNAKADDTVLEVMERIRAAGTLPLVFAARKPNDRTLRPAE